MRQSTAEAATWPTPATRGRRATAPRLQVRQLAVPQHAVMCMLVVLACGAISLLYLVQTSSVASNAYRIEQLKAENEALVRTNEALQLKIAGYESLSSIEDTARDKLGMQPVKDFEFLYVPVGVQH
ncbi:MAG: septum formation initiator family protein [Chloroflexi bacterium]|nr:septum formation initiator family protein [Chloroflexota bacterium]